MRKGKDMLGKPIVAYVSGRKIANIKDLIFSRSDNSLLGFLVRERSLFSDAKVLPIQSVKSIGIDAIIVASEDAIADARAYPDIDNMLESNNILNGTRLMTTDGRNLGRLVDLYFDDRAGTIEGYETSGGLFADAYSGRSFVPAAKTLKIGRDVAFVPPETVALMEEQVGGIKAAMQNASERIQQTAQVAGEKIQETAQTTSEKLQAAGQTGSNLTTSAIAGWTIERAQGRRAQHAVYSTDGYIVVAQGQIVTPQTIERAKATRRELAVLEAVGLSPTAAAQSQAGALATATGDRLKTTTTVASDRLQEGTSNIWERVKETSNKLQDRSAQAIETKRINGALGRATTRVILDRQDRPILNLGELITHQAIDTARTEGVLDILLDSVYTETPHLSIEELRAPSKGQAAL